MSIGWEKKEKQLEKLLDSEYFLQPGI